MAAFGNSLASVNVQNQAFDLVHQGAGDFGATIENELQGESVIAAVLGSMLNDAVPVPSGTSAAPGLAFGADSDSGFYRVGANEIGVVASAAIVGGWTASGMKLGSTSSTVLAKFSVYSVSLTPAARTDGSGATEATFTVTGIVSGEKIFVNPPAVSANNVAVSWRMTASDTVQAVFVQTSASTTAAAGTYHFVAFQTA